jgi:hypothetical protein
MTRSSYCAFSTQLFANASRSARGINPLRRSHRCRGLAKRGIITGRNGSKNVGTPNKARRSLVRTAAFFFSRNGILGMVNLDENRRTSPSPQRS